MSMIKNELYNFEKDKELFLKNEGFTKSPNLYYGKESWYFHTEGMKYKVSVYVNDRTLTVVKRNKKTNNEIERHKFWYTKDNFDKIYVHQMLPLAKKWSYENS